MGEDPYCHRGVIQDVLDSEAESDESRFVVLSRPQV